MKHYPPSALGFPEKYRIWRPNQAETIETIKDSPKKFHILSAPAGSGKSAIYTAVAKLLGLEGKRTLILTGSKALQDQLAADFSAVDFNDVRGMANYICPILRAERAWEDKCDHGPCRTGYQCEEKRPEVVVARLESGDTEEGCPYYLALERARQSQIVSSNYAFYLAIHNYAGGLGQFDCLVLDEAHEVENWITNFLSVQLHTRSLRLLEEYYQDPYPEDYDPIGWNMWASNALPYIPRKPEGSDDAERGDRIKNLRRDLEIIARKVSSNWFCGKWTINRSYAGVRFVPLRPLDFVKPALGMSNFRKVILTSATITEESGAHILNLTKDEKDHATESYNLPSHFEVARRPLYWVPTCRITYRTTEGQMQRWTNRIDEIICNRLHLKGVIHCVSYARAIRLKETSTFREFMIVHQSGEAAEAIERLRDADPPAILVSPSISTGVDLAGDLVRFQIIGKLPFPNTMDEAVKARIHADKQFQPILVANLISQSYGRGVRSSEDWCETFIIDDSIQWFKSKHLNLFPAWVLQAFKRVDAVPPLKEF